MKLLFVTPPMGNWAPWGDRHLAVNSLHSQVAAFIREKKAADVAVLDCRALGLDDEQMLNELGRRLPDAVFFGSVIPAAGGAAQLNRFHAAMKRIKESYPKTVTIGGGLMYTAVPQQIMKEIHSLISRLSAFSVTTNTRCGSYWRSSNVRRRTLTGSRDLPIARAAKSYSIQPGR